MDLGDWMDVNRFGYYNLLGFSQNHNNAIPFPGNPLAAMFTIEPKDAQFFFSAGIANSSQSSLNAGFEELTDGRTSPFVMAELGLKMNFANQPGIYRFIGWYDGKDLPVIGSQTPIAGGGIADSRYGLALSFDQNVTADLGLFARYGFADQSEFNPKHYWQAGFDWKGVIPGRPKDDLAIGVVQNIFTDRRKATIAKAADYETYVEAYYNVVVYDWFQIQPVLQVLANPGGVTQEPSWILGVHLAFRF
jgi:carbohydrate-selective porin OprB